MKKSRIDTLADRYLQDGVTIEDKLINTDFIRIQNRDQYITKVPNYHGDDPRYARFWSREIKRCIEGKWGKMFGGYRYMRGPTYYYGNYFLLQETDRNKKTQYMRPQIDDLEWEISYYIGVCRGFSGFANDTKYTCLKDVKSYLDSEDQLYTLEYLQDSYPDAFHDGELKEYVDPYEYIRRIHSKPLGRALYQNQTYNGQVAGSRGGGKASPLYIPVLTESGWKKNGDLSIGEKVYGRDGKLHPITGIFPQGDKEIYQITFQDGRTMECCEDHLWLVRQVKNGGKYGVLSVREMLDKGISRPGKKGCTWTYQVPINEPVQFPEKELPIDPYLLGCLLSDGTLTTLTPKIACSDPHVLNRIRTILSDFELKYDTSTNNNYTIVDRNKDVITITDRNGNTYQQRSGNRLTTALRDNNLQVKGEEKYIPQIYLEASVEQRMELLRGLIDSDGCVSTSGSSEFTNNSEKLVDGVAALCRSLGIRCMKSFDLRAGEAHEIKGHHFTRGKTFRLYINTTKVIASSPEKVKRLQAKNLTNSQMYVSIVDIQPTGEFVPQQCISVDSQDHTYITKDYIVTHNSYNLAGEMEHTLLFDGATAYDKEFVEDKLIAELCLGSGDSDKSSELFSKIIASISAKANFELSEKHGFGAYKTNVTIDGKVEEVVKPSPLYRDFVGNTTPPNKKNPYRYNYLEEVNGRWTLTGGTGSKLYHVNYSDKKADGAQAGAGGRYLMSVIEEGGLLECIEAVNRSNDSTVAREGIRFGSEFYIGTSGNLMKVGGFRKMMENPQDYSIYPLKNKYGTEGKDNMIGFFLPFYMTLRQFKDKDGNTDFKRAAMYVEVIRKQKAQSSDPEAIRLEKMNRPCWLEEMWLSLDGNIMPYQELDDRERELMAFNNYEFVEKCVNLVWDSSQPNGVKYILDDTLEPFREFPVNMSKRKSPQGCIVLYDLPMNVGGGIPDDMYCFVGHDPYVEQDLNKGGSIGSTYILMNPKYCDGGAKGNTIVAAYNDKPLQGLDRYYDNQMKLLALYGNPQRGLWFEKNRGDYCRSFYLAKNQPMLLAPTPQWTQGSKMYAQRVSSYGYTVGNKLRKIELAKLMRDWLLEETTLADGTKKNVERLNDLFLIRQLKVYNLDDNFDAVDGFRGCIVGLREHQTRMESEITTDDRRKQQKVLKFYLNNDRIFKKPGR